MSNSLDLYEVLCTSKDSTLITDYEGTPLAMSMPDYKYGGRTIDLVCGDYNLRVEDLLQNGRYATVEEGLRGYYELDKARESVHILEIPTYEAALETFLDRLIQERFRVFVPRRLEIFELGDNAVPKIGNRGVQQEFLSGDEVMRYIKKSYCLVDKNYSQNLHISEK